MRTLVGNYLNNDEKKELLASIQEKKEFSELIVAMKQHTAVDFKEDSVKLERAFKFDLAHGETVVSAKAMKLVIDENVHIHYITRYKNGNVDNTSDIIVGHIFSNKVDQDVTLHKIFSKSEGGEIKTKVKEVPVKDVEYVTSLEDKFIEGFNFDENYVPGQLLDQVNLAEKDWLKDGCLPGGYIYCGGGCGGYPACKSSVKGVNELDDECCKYHDCCYALNDVTKHKICDAIICECAKIYLGDYIGAAGVVATFCL